MLYINNYTLLDINPYEIKNGRYSFDLIILHDIAVINFLLALTAK